MAGGGSFGSGPSGKSGSAPGYVDPFSMGVLNQNTGLAEQAMHNRYAQLGLGVPGGGSAGGSAPQAAATGQNLQYGGAGTAEQMDLGMLPSLTGGIPGMSQATLGEMQNNALASPAGGGGSGGKGGGGLGGLGSLAMLGGF